jgi:hypothetical protein
MSSDEGLARMKADSDRQTDALLALMADVDEKQQAALMELAAQSHRVADWMVSYLSERQGEAS